jgi:hypothetical protein
MISMSTRRKRTEDISRRLGTVPNTRFFCAVINCGQPTRAASGTGLNRHYCRRHEDHFQRHGSYLKPSYSAAELAPYRKAAESWLVKHQSDPYVRHALLKVGRLLASGRPEEAFRLRGLSPEDRAAVAWGRLRKADVNPIRPLAAWLAVEMRFIDDRQPDRSPEFKHVQAAKVVHRMASGTHKRWEREGPDGRPKVVEMHKYPASRGRVLRHIGRQLEGAAELLVEHHLATIRSTVRLPARPPQHL